MLMLSPLFTGRRNCPKIPGYAEVDVRVVRNGDIQDDGVRWTTLPLRSVSKSEAARAVVKKDDILITTSGDCGYSAHIETDPERQTIASNFVRILRFDGGRVVPRYMYHYIHSQAFRSRLSPYIRGTTLKNLSLSTAADHIEVLLPDRPSQLRMATILDKAEALRAKRRAAFAQVETLSQAIFLAMFGDPIANRRGWPKQRLDTLGTLNRGVSKHRPRNAPELLGGPYPFVQTGDVSNSGGYIRTFTSTYSEAGLRQSRMWPAGTLCITIAANIAKTGILMFDACFPDSVVAFRSDAATVEFVRIWLSFLQASIEERAPESAQKNINLEVLRSLAVPTPDMDLRREFARVVHAVEALKDGYRISLSQLNNLFTSLQQRAFRGEL